MFQYGKPESVGISSEDLLGFYRMLDRYQLQTHSVIMARGGVIVTECYYKPFDERFEHRMYSVSKSFMAIAVGLAMTEGLLRLDDRVIDYFPEYRNENFDELYAETTIRDMLTMRSNVAGMTPWWGKYDDRVRAYFEQRSRKVPGTNFYYDSMGCSLLGVIVEKLTGMTFLDYLKDRVLLKMGFSAESYDILAPGGYSMGDSGVVCTARDLLIFTKFVADGGCFEGKRYIDEQFMRDAVSAQSDNQDNGGIMVPYRQGYGYLIWKTPDDGFAFIGMGDQLAVCDPKHDFIFVITSDNQGAPEARALIFHELYQTVIDSISDHPLPENEGAYRALTAYTESRALTAQHGAETSPTADRVNGVRYELTQNPMGIADLRLTFDGEGGTFEFTRGGVKRVLPFGLGRNTVCPFPDDRRAGLTASEMIDGTYRCASSGAWTNPDGFLIRAQIIDTYFGRLNIRLGFKDERVSVEMTKSGQYVLEGYAGYAVGRAAR